MNKNVSNKNVKSTNVLNPQIKFFVDFESFSDKDLYTYCKKVGYNTRIWHRRFVATIPEVAKRRLYKKYGYCSIKEFAGKLAGVSHTHVDEVLRVNEKFKEMPKMKALIGEVGLSKLKIVACIVTKETESFWAEKVKYLTKSSLEIYVREMKSIGINDLFINNRQTLNSQGRIVAKFPGEAMDESVKISQEQEQISMFDSESHRSQNADQTSLENIQKHDKKTFMIHIDEETEFELRKFKLQLEKERKEPIDWNFALKEIVKRAKSEQAVRNHKTVKKELVSDPRTEPKKSTTESNMKIKQKSATASNKRTAASRYIPAKIKHSLQQKYQGHCAYKNCSKPAEQIHHSDGFAKTKNHENLIPLCKNHHDFLHHTSMIDNVFKKFKSEFAV